MQQVYKSFKGTAREFIAAGVTINGKEINQPGLSLMAQYGVAKIVGEVPRPEGKKGHPEKICLNPFEFRAGLKRSTKGLP